MARPLKPLIESGPDAEVRLVQRLAAIFCTMEEIAAVCNVSVDTLERRFADPIKRGKNIGKASLRRHQWQNAANGNATMQIWLGKQELGQTDKVTNQAPGANFGFGDSPRPDATGNNSAITIQ